MKVNHLKFLSNIHHATLIIKVFRYNLVKYLINDSNYFIRSGWSASIFDCFRIIFLYFPFFAKNFFFCLTNFNWILNSRAFNLNWLHKFKAQTFYIFQLFHLLGAKKFFFCAITSPRSWAGEKNDSVANTSVTFVQVWSWMRVGDLDNSFWLFTGWKNATIVYCVRRNQIAIITLNEGDHRKRFDGRLEFRKIIACMLSNEA